MCDTESSRSVLLHLSSLFLSNRFHFTVCPASFLKNITARTYPCFHSTCFPLGGIPLWSLFPFLLEHPGCIFQHLGCRFTFQPLINCPVTAQCVPRTDQWLEENSNSDTFFPQGSYRRGRETWVLKTKRHCPRCERCRQAQGGWGGGLQGALGEQRHPLSSSLVQSPGKLAEELNIERSLETLEET